MKEKTIKVLLILLLSILCMELDAQIVIREKVKIKPSTKLLSQLSVTEGYSPIEIHASGPRSFTISVTGPGGGGSKSNDGSGSPPTLISVGAVNGIYQISVESGCECNTSVGVWVTWINPWGETDLICSYELWFYGPRKSSVSFSFNGVHEDDPPPIEFNYSVDITEGILCGERASDVFASPNCDIDSLPNKNIQLSIASNGPDCVLFDKISNQIAGTTVTTTFDKVNDYGIKLNSPFTGAQTQVKLLAYSNGIEHADSMFVKPAETEYYLDADNYLVNLIHGMAATLKIKLYPGTDCSDTRLALDLLLNLEITTGDSLGHLINPLTGEAGRLFNGLNFTNGELAFDFIADGSKPDGEDTVYVSVTTNNPNIWQYDFIILINEGKIVVQFVPDSIVPGGIADIVLKKKEADGTLTSFPQDQSFNLSLVKGKDYGTINYLYRGMWSDTTDNVEFSSEPFKFTSRANLTNTPVQSAITVSTYLDSGERIWGGAVINIGEDTQVDTFYVKADFEKESLVAGDTVRVLVKKVDKFGNEGSFPAGTLFEASVMEGCTAGELMKGNSKGVYLNNLTEPFYFVVSDSLTAADTLVTIKVGVPQEDGVTYLSYDDFYGKTNGGLSLSIVSNGVASIIPKPAKVTSACSTHEITLPSDRARLVKAKVEFLGTVYTNIQDRLIKKIVNGEMPKIICKVRTNNYNEGRIQYEWTFGVYYEFKRYNKDGNLCSRTGALEFKGFSYANNSNISEWKVPFSTDSLSYVLLKAKDFRNSGCDQKTTIWSEGENVLIGGKVYIKARALNANQIASGKEIGWVDYDSLKIIGKNPDPMTEVKDYTNDLEVFALMFRESTFQQFNNSDGGVYTVKGYPKYGPPNGYGLMQIDYPAATELQLWDWRKNVDAGKNLYYNDPIKKPAAEKLVKKLFAPEIPTKEQLLKEAWQRYNGGNYWGKVMEDGTWVIKKVAKIYNQNSGEWEDNPHADKCWEKYIELGGN